MTDSMDEILAPKPARERDESGRFKSKGETTEVQETPVVEAKAPAPEATPEPTPAAPPAVEPAKPVEQTPEDRVPLAALKSERQKRQEIERKYAELERQQRLASQPKAPDPYADPDGHRQFVAQQNSVIDAKVNASFASAKRAIPDFEEVMAHWDGLKAEHPYLYDQAIQDDAPAYWAYEQVKRHLALQEIGDPISYREKVKAELLAELQQKTPQQQKPATPPPSLASAPSSGRVSTESAWSGPTSMTSILSRR